MHKSPQMFNESFEGKSNWKYFQCWIVYVEPQAPKASTSSPNDSALHDKFKLQTRNFLYWIYNFSSKHMHLYCKALALFFFCIFKSLPSINLFCLIFSDLSSETYLRLTYILLDLSKFGGPNTIVFRISKNSILWLKKQEKNTIGLCKEGPAIGAFWIFDLPTGYCLQGSQIQNAPIARHSSMQTYPSIKCTHHTPMSLTHGGQSTLRQKFVAKS
jgi:hypothetical protein